MSLQLIQPFLTKSKELRAREPAISYFCLYLAVQRALESKLHVSDPKVAEQVTNLLTELETLKGELTEYQNVLNDSAEGQKYAEDFATSIFDQGYLAVESSTATKQTAAMLAASAVFLSLGEIWEPLSDERKSQIKFAKFHAARILKALKSGEDPNPGKEDLEEPLGDEGVDLKNSNAAAVPGTDGFDVVHQGNGAVNTNDSHLTTPSSAPNDSEPDNSSSKFDYDTFKPPYMAICPPKPDNPQPPQPPAKPTQLTTTQPQFNAKQILSLTDATSNAQKHAKYAISAMNYDDISTAIKELRESLEILTKYESQK